MSLKMLNLMAIGTSPVPLLLIFEKSDGSSGSMKSLAYTAAIVAFFPKPGGTTSTPSLLIMFYKDVQVRVTLLLMVQT